MRNWLVITKAYDLVKELMERVNRWPRSHKFVLGDRILNNAFGLLDLLLEAKYSCDRLCGRSGGPGAGARSHCQLGRVFGMRGHLGLAKEVVWTKGIQAPGGPAWLKQG